MAKKPPIKFKMDKFGQSSVRDFARFLIFIVYHLFS